MNSSKCEISNPLYFRNAFLEIDEMRADISNCDVCLNPSGTRKIYAHKVVLAAGSNYFRTMFFSSERFIERSEGEVTLKEVDPDALEEIVNYMYTGKLKLSEYNIQSLLKTSDQLGIDWVKEKSFGFFEQILSATNCFSFWQLSDRMKNDDIKLSVLKFISNNLEQIIQTKEFLNLELEKLIILATNENVQEKDPEILFSGITNWIKLDIESREKHYYDLIKSVPLIYMTKAFLKTNVAREELIVKSHKCTMLLTEALLYHICPEEIENSDVTGKVQKGDNGRKIFPDRHNNFDDINKTCADVKRATYVFLLGSVKDKYKCLGQIYNPYVEYFKLVKPIGVQRSFAGIAAYQDNILVAGGIINNVSSMCTEIYNIGRNEWTFAKNKTYPVHFNQLIKCQDYIYSCGGWSTSSRTFCEKYDVHKNDWYKIEEMKLSNTCCSADVIDNCIYAATSKIQLIQAFSADKATIQKYDPRIGNWDIITNIPHGVSDASVAYINGNFYISWSTSDCTELAKFDFRNLQFIKLESMCTRRVGHSLVNFGGVLYAVGGEYINTVEEYNQKNNSWTFVKNINGSFEHVRCVVPLISK